MLVEVPLPAHLVGVALLIMAGSLATLPYFLPVEAPVEDALPSVTTARAWLEPRTLLIGMMVLAFALTEGTANDWLALALQSTGTASSAGWACSASPASWSR